MSAYMLCFVLLLTPCLAETSNSYENLIHRLEYLEKTAKQVAVQGRVITELRDTTAEVKKTNTDLIAVNVALRSTNKALVQTNKDLQERNAELYKTNKELHEVIAKLLEPSMDDHGTNVYLHQGNLSPLSGAQSAKRFVMNNEGPIAFTVGISPWSVNHLKHHDTITFETTITDIGGGYNNQSGVFVAPVSGIYLFSCSLMDDLEEHGLMLHAEIVHNQRVLGRIFAHAEPNNHRDQGAQTVVTYAKQGDQVWVRTIDNQDLGLGGELYSTFTGYLLFAM